MKYEVSNICYKSKPSEYEITHCNPFRKNKYNVDDTYYTTIDTPRKLYDIWARGFSLKPRAFNFKNNSDAKVNTIILDFDNLTEVQYEFLKNVVKGKCYRFEYLAGCGDDSAGMKSDRQECISQGIEFRPKHYKFKLFYPTSCLCRYDEVKEAYLEAIGFLNPIFSKEEVRKTWELWLKANNKSKYYKHDGKTKKHGVWIVHKKGDKRIDLKKSEVTIEDERFKGWILPDVAMLNNYRTQITYGVNVNQDNRIERIDDEIIAKLVGNTQKFRGTKLSDYEGLDWKDMLDATKDAKVDVNKELNEKLKKRIREYIDALAPHAELNRRTWYPISSSDFSKRLGMPKIDDLVVDSNSKLIASWIWNNRLGETRKMEKSSILCEIRTITTTMTRNAIEYNRWGKKLEASRILDDITMIVRQRYNRDAFKEFLRFGWLDNVIDTMARSMIRARDGYVVWRLKMKAKNIKFENDDEVLAPLREFYATNDREMLGEYKKRMEVYVKNNMEMLKNTKSEYRYRRRGLKKELIDRCMSGVYGEIDNEEKWIEICSGIVNSDKDGDITHELLSSWYVEFNRQFRKATNSKGYKTKYKEMFKGKTKEEIAKIIDGLDLTRQAKYDLRKKYTR